MSTLIENNIDDIQSVSALCFGLDFTNKVIPLVIKHFDTLKQISNSANYRNLSAEIKLALAVYILPLAKNKYNTNNISDIIFYSTMYDIKIWADRYFKQSGKLGLENYDWIKNHLNLELFRIGRLQYQFSKLKLPYFIGLKGLIKADFLCGKCLVIHIPEGEKLIFNECLESIMNAQKFFKHYYPKYNYKGYVCQSWLLYKNNKLFMRDNSNILQFQKLFNIVANTSNSAQAKERIFKFDYNKNSPTSLQKAVLNYKGKQKILGEGFGFVKQEFLTQ